MQAIEPELKCRKFHLFVLIIKKSNFTGSQESGFRSQNEDASDWIWGFGGVAKGPQFVLQTIGGQFAGHSGF